MDKILTYFLGHKVVIVTAHRLHCYMKFEQVFVFNDKLKDSDIKSILWKLNQYSATQIRRIRTKKINAVRPNNYQTVLKEKVVEFYD